MQPTHRPWLRGALTLTALAVFGAATLVSNVSAVSERKEASKRFVKKRIAQVRAEVAGLRDDIAAFQASDDGPVALDDTLTPVQSLALPAGTYVVVAKTVLDLLASSPGCECELRVGGTLVDTSRGALGEGAGVVSDTVTLVGQHTLPGPGSAELSCKDSGTGNDAEAADSKILAIAIP